MSVKKDFHVGTQEVNVLSNISLTISEGEFAVIFGPSGCGKSTLLHILLGLEPPSFGIVKFGAQDLYRHLDEDGRSVLRKKNIGMVYQQPNWIKSLSVIDNVAFPLVLNGITQEEARKIALQKIQELGMADWAEYRPGELSSGQQQKIALARGMSTNPQLIIADEPTGNLDYKSGVELMDLLQGLNKQGKTIIMVTHDLDYLSYASVAIEMFDGHIVHSYSRSEIPSLLKGANKAKIAKWEQTTHAE
jgi:putative ABC transport system ATP-binding protein